MLDDRHTFIVRVWLERNGDEADAPLWRAQIILLPSGEQCYLKDGNELFDYIAAYLERLGIKLWARWRLLQWLRRGKDRLVRAWLRR